MIPLPEPSLQQPAPQINEARNKVFAVPPMASGGTKSESIFLFLFILIILRLKILQNRGHG